MTQTITYVSLAPAWTEVLTTVDRKTLSLVESADMGTVGTGQMQIQDDTGTAGHSSDGILGHKSLKVEQDACAVARSFTGFFGPRTYSRGENQVGAGRLIDATLLDGNAVFGFRSFHGTTGKRPAESASARLTWLLGSAQLSSLIADTGYVVYRTDVSMDANDYANGYPGDVLADIALACHAQYWAFYDEVAGELALWFDDSNTSTAFSSTIRISNVASDVDATTTFAPFTDARLVKDPQHVYSGVSYPYAKGSVYATRPSTASTYAWRDGVAPNANVKTAAVANRQASRFLLENRTEEERVTVTIQVGAATVNLLRAGHRMQARFSHLPGWESMRWARVTQRTMRHVTDLDTDYYLDVELSPQEDFTEPCCGLDALGGVYTRDGGTAAPPFPDSGSHSYTFTPDSPPPTATVQWLSQPGNGSHGGTAWQVIGTPDDGVGYWGLEGGVAHNLDRIAVRYAFDLGVPTSVCSALIGMRSGIPTGAARYDGHPSGYAGHTTDGSIKVYVQGSADGVAWTTIADYDVVAGNVIPGTSPHSALIAYANVPLSGEYQYWGVVYDRHLSDGGFAGLIAVETSDYFWTFSLYLPGDC